MGRESRSAVPGGRQAEGVVWLERAGPGSAGDLTVLDCRPFVAACLRTVPDTGEAFALLQRAAREAPPAGSNRLLDVIFRLNRPGLTEALTTALRDGVVPEAATADRWRVRMADGRLIAERNWTGQVVHSLEVLSTSQGTVVLRLLSDWDDTFGSPAFAVAEVTFLLRQILLGEQEAPFPIPPGLAPGREDAIARSGWSRHGSLARFGYLVDTSDAEVERGSADLLRAAAHAHPVGDMDLPAAAFTALKP